MTHVDAFRISANPLPRPARLHGLARPAIQGLMLAAFMLLTRKLDWYAIGRQHTAEVRHAPNA